MIHRMFCKQNHELGLTPATRKLLADRKAENKQDEHNVPRFYESICMPAVGKVDEPFLSLVKKENENAVDR